MIEYVHPPNSKGLPYPGPVEFTRFQGLRVVEGYHAAYILEVFDERLRLSTSEGVELRILTYHSVVVLAFMTPAGTDLVPSIVLDQDWFSALRSADDFVELFDDSKSGPVEGKEQLRAIRIQMN